MYNVIVHVVDRHSKKVGITRTVGPFATREEANKATRGFVEEVDAEYQKWANYSALLSEIVET